MKKTFGSDSVFTRACLLLQSCPTRLCRVHSPKATLRTFCAAAVLAPCEDRHTSSPYQIAYAGIIHSSPALAT